MINIKLWKLIVLAVLIVILTVSLTFNIFFTNMFGIHDSDSFKQALLSKEILNGLVNVGDSDDIENNLSNNSSNNTDTNNELQKGEIVFQKERVTITFVRQESGLLGPSFIFMVKNELDIYVNVSFIDLYLDDFLLEISGGNTFDIAPGKSATIELKLWESEYEDFVDSPQKLEYVIRLWDSETWNDIARENKIIYLK
jgi:hypothetical protein